jgi:hypothetical protein
LNTAQANRSAPNGPNGGSLDPLTASEAHTALLPAEAANLQVIRCRWLHVPAPDLLQLLYQREAYCRSTAIRDGFTKHRRIDHQPGQCPGCASASHLTSHRAATHRSGFEPRRARTRTGSIFCRPDRIAAVTCRSTRRHLRQLNHSLVALIRTLRFARQDWVVRR